MILIGEKGRKPLLSYSHMCYVHRPSHSSRLSSQSKICEQYIPLSPNLYSYVQSLYILLYITKTVYNIKPHVIQLSPLPIYITLHHNKQYIPLSSTLDTYLHSSLYITLHHNKQYIPLSPML
jgi:hypothetical protein